MSKQALPDPVLVTTSTRHRVPARPRLSVRGLVVGAVLLAAALLLRAAAPAGELLDRAVRDAVTLAISVVIESLPFVFVGIAVSAIVQLWVPARVIFRLVPRTPVLRRMVLSTLGVVLPVCECGNLPLARGLMTRGLSVPDAMTFLLAAPILNPVTIITTYQAFGWDDGILVSRVVGGFVIANLVGWIFSRHPAPQVLLSRPFQHTCRVEAGAVARGDRLRRGVDLFAHETSAMLPALFVGAAVAGLIQAAVSRELLVTLGSNPVWSVFALMLLAFVIAICSSVDAFFALALGSAFLPGGIVAFLVLGPMIDVKMLAMFRTTFSWRTVLQLTAIVATATAVLGLGVNLLG